MTKRPDEERSWGSEADQARRDLQDSIVRLKEEVREYRRRVSRDDRRDDDERDGDRP